MQDPLDILKEALQLAERGELLGFQLAVVKNDGSAKVACVVRGPITMDPQLTETVNLILASETLGWATKLMEEMAHARVNGLRRKQAAASADLGQPS